MPWEIVVALVLLTCLAQACIKVSWYGGSGEEIVIEAHDLSDNNGLSGSLKASASRIKNLIQETFLSNDRYKIKKN